MEFPPPSVKCSPLSGPLWFCLVHLTERLAIDSRDSDSNSALSPPPISPIVTLALETAGSPDVSSLTEKENAKGFNGVADGVREERGRDYATKKPEKHERVESKVSPMAAVLARAVDAVSHELVWKVWLEGAMVAERAGGWATSGEHLVQAIRACPRNLQWKIWISGARMELRRGCSAASVRDEAFKASYLRASALLTRAVSEVPRKTKATALIECSRVEALAGKIASARRILAQARSAAPHAWKVYYESIFLELSSRGETAQDSDSSERSGNEDAELAMEQAVARSLVQAKQALLLHNGTGRLWAILVQLQPTPSLRRQTFKAAVQRVPKSGEVWCEGVRMSLDPSSKYFNLRTAKKCLDFALEFTPQYGDTFVEYLRFVMLTHRESQEASARVFRLCSNADPNYGACWFRCKQQARKDRCFNGSPDVVAVLKVAQRIIAQDLFEHRSLYNRALLRNLYKPRGDADNMRAEALLAVHGDGVITNGGGLLTGDRISPTLLESLSSPETSPNTRPQDSDPLAVGRVNLPPVVDPSPSHSSVASSNITATNPECVAVDACDDSGVGHDENPRLIQAWRHHNLNSLAELYPNIQTLPLEARHHLLFGFDPVLF